MTVDGPASRSYIAEAVDLALKLHRSSDGDGHILVFLTGTYCLAATTSSKQQWGRVPGIYRNPQPLSLYSNPDPISNSTLRFRGPVS